MPLPGPFSIQMCSILLVTGIALPSTAHAEEPLLNAPSIEEVMAACPRPWTEVRDALRSETDVLKFPVEGFNAIYMPEVEWNTVRFSLKSAFSGFPKIPVDLASPLLSQATPEGVAARSQALQACLAAPGEKSLVPYITGAGAGKGMLVLRGDEVDFSCTTESICEFVWAGKKYNVRNSAVRRKMSCANYRPAKSLPRKVQYDVTDLDPYFPDKLEPDAHIYLWAQRGSLCLPIPDKPGTYKLTFRASQRPTKKWPTGKFWVCRLNQSTFSCGVETQDLDAEGLAYTGRDAGFSRVVKVTRDSVAVAP